LPAWVCPFAICLTRPFLFATFPAWLWLSVTFLVMFCLLAMFLARGFPFALVPLQTFLPHKRPPPLWRHRFAATPSREPAAHDAGATPAMTTMLLGATSSRVVTVAVAGTAVFTRSRSSDGPAAPA
jgi:hypothetical protein